MKLGYENTDKKIEIEIYGIKFEIKNVNSIKNFEDVEDDDLKGLEKIIESVLGKGSIEKINEQRKKDGYKEIDSSVALNLLIGIYQTYTSEYTENILQPLEKSVNRIDNYNRKVGKYNNRGKRRYGRY